MHCVSIFCLGSLPKQIWIKDALCIGVKCTIMFRILFLHKRHSWHLWKGKKISILVLVSYVFLLHSSLKIPENKRYRKWERNLVNLFEFFFETNGLFWLFCKIIIKENTTTPPWYCTIKRNTYKKKGIELLPNACCNWQVFVQMFDYLWKSSQQLLTQNKTKCLRMTKHLPARTKITDRYVSFSHGEDEEIKARWYWKVLRW